MSVYTSVETPGWDDGPDARPYLDVAHDNGCDGKQVRLIIGQQFDRAVYLYLSPTRARVLAAALDVAADRAEAEW